MTHLRGALGWMFVAAMAMVLGACDDPQKNCHDVVNKYDECAPKIIDESLKALPEHFAPMLEEKKGELTQKLDATVAERRSQGQGGTFSDSEKRVHQVHEGREVSRPARSYRM